MDLKRSLLSLALLALVCGCSAREPQLRMDEVARIPPPGVVPVSGSGTAWLVPYPGSRVSYVAGVSGEVYQVDDTYYCFFARRWYYAHELGEGWRHVQMKHVPRALFRVRGNLPPGLPRSNPAAGVEDY